MPRSVHVVSLALLPALTIAFGGLTHNTHLQPFGGLTHNSNQGSSGSAGVSAPLPVFERPGDQEVPRGWDEVRLNPLKATRLCGFDTVN